MIKNIKFLSPVAIGPDSSPETFLEQNQVLLAFKLTITLDQDDRFLLITGKHIDGKPPFQQYIPLTAVSTILTDAYGLAHNPPAVKKA